MKITSNKANTSCWTFENVRTPKGNESRKGHRSYKKMAKIQLTDPFKRGIWRAQNRWRRWGNHSRPNQIGGPCLVSGRKSFVQVFHDQNVVKFHRIKRVSIRIGQAEVAQPEPKKELFVQTRPFLPFEPTGPDGLRQALSQSTFSWSLILKLRTLIPLISSAETRSPRTLVNQLNRDNWWCLAAEVLFHKLN